MTDKEKTNSTEFDITPGIGIVKFKVTRGDKQLYDAKLPIATAADIGNGLLRAAAQSEVIEVLLKDAWNFSAALIKSIASAEALEKGQDEEVKNSVREVLKKLSGKLKKEKQND